ncbi:MAG: hypothetical protein HY854_10305 [Burkholderiales bacterium]|nr:hypothetical protein [Burkholderiales bacterium]
MALLGPAALAMWWDMAPGRLAEFEHWHSTEHFPERLAIAGFRRASRWLAADGGEGVFVLYELQSHAVLSSPGYARSLNQPTPWSRQMMPHHRNMVRTQCHVVASQGAGVAGYAATFRLPHAPPAALGSRPGITGVHVLRHEAPAMPATTEQQIRGADAEAAWVMVVTGYSPEALRALPPVPGAVQGFYRLSLSATPGDMA